MDIVNIAATMFMVNKSWIYFRHSIFLLRYDKVAAYYIDSL